MNIDLSGKTAVVSGSTGGIGLAIAKGLAGSGAHVVVNGRSEKRVKDAVAAVRQAAPDAHVTGVACDLATAEGADKLTTQAGEADILVNNMGIFEPKPFAEIPDADWQRFFDTNVMSGVRLSRFYLPKMVAKGWGRVVFISSESALNIPKEMIHYGMTKTAQLAISRGLAESVANTGVTVNAVLPGPTLSEGVEEMLRSETKDGTSIEEAGRRFIAQYRPTSLIGRLATPEEVANLVVYTCSPQASATSGAALRVDGGVLRGLG
jgi:NAD(P)-dependent dehydrogenase (short-subunit alcohol dehydrogenase family)